MIYPNYTHNVKASIKAQLPNFASESPQQIEDSDWFPDIDELVEQAEDHRDEREAYEETIGKTERKMHTLFLVQSILEAKLDEMESDSFESLELHVEKRSVAWPSAASSASSASTSASKPSKKEPTSETQ